MLGISRLILGLSRLILGLSRLILGISRLGALTVGQLVKGGPGLAMVLAERLGKLLETVDQRQHRRLQFLAFGPRQGGDAVAGDIDMLFKAVEVDYLAFVQGAAPNRNGSDCLRAPRPQVFGPECAGDPGAPSPPPFALRALPPWTLCP